MANDGYKELEIIFNSRDNDKKDSFINKVNVENRNKHFEDEIDISKMMERAGKRLEAYERQRNLEIKEIQDNRKNLRKKIYKKSPKLIKKERKFKVHRNNFYIGKKIKNIISNMGYIILLSGVGIVTVVGTCLLFDAVIAFGEDNTKLDINSNDITVIRYDESSNDSDILENSISNEFSNTFDEVSIASNSDINYSKIPIENSFDEEKILNFLDNTQSGYYVKKYCDKYGVDPYVFSSICNVESGFDHFSCIPGGDFYNGYGVGICQIESPSGNEIGTYDVEGNYNSIVVSMDNMVDEEKNIEAGVISYKDNVDRLYYVLSNKYKDVDDSILKAATVYFSIPCYNMGLPAMMYIIDNYNVIKDNEFCFQQFQDGLTYIHHNPSALVSGWEGLYGNDKYFEKVWSCLPPNQEINTFVDDSYVSVNTSYVRPAISQNQSARVI